jgi:hypothetical protein
LVKPIIVNETFSHAVFFRQSNKQSQQSPDNNFGGLVKIKGKTIESKLGSESATSRGLGSTLLHKNYCSVTRYLLFLSHVFSKTKWGGF